MSSCCSQHTGSPNQIIEAQYLDQKILMKLLRDIYGTNDGKNMFRVEAGGLFPFNTSILSNC